MKKLPEVEWLLVGGRSDAEDVVRTADSFTKPLRRTTGTSREMAPFMRYEKGELAQDLCLEVASALRGELLDFFLIPMIGDDRGVADGAVHLSRRSERVLADDHSGMAAMVLASVVGDAEAIYPIQALDLLWSEGQQAMMILSVGKDKRASWFVSVVVAPYLEYFEDETVEAEAMAILEHRWQEIPGDGSLTRSLMLGLSGDLEGLAKLGFVDRSCRVNDQ